MKILLVEDEALLRIYVKRLLKNLGVDDVLETAFGEEAVSLAEKEQPDLILMDIRIMGRYNGVEAARQLEDKVTIPIVFMSAYDVDTEDQIKNLKNFLAYHTKPIDRRILASVIKRIKDKEEKDEIL